MLPVMMAVCLLVELGVEAPQELLNRIFIAINVNYSIHSNKRIWYHSATLEMKSFINIVIIVASIIIKKDAFE